MSCAVKKTETAVPFVLHMHRSLFPVLFFVYFGLSMHLFCCPPLLTRVPFPRLLC